MTGDLEVLRTASVALIALRRVKSETKVFPHTPLLKVSLEVPQTSKAAIEEVLVDLSVASKVEEPFELVSHEMVEDGEIETRIVSLEFDEAPVECKKT